MPNATQLLRQDHRKVEGLFKKCENAKGMDAKRRFAIQAINELDVHAQVEEKIFYPAVKKAIDETHLVDEAKKEHQEAKSLMSQLKRMRGQDDEAAEKFESRFSELVEAVQHHVKEEEGEMFPKVEDSELDLSGLGSEMAGRKKQLMQQMGRANKQSRSVSRGKTRAKSKSKRRTRSRSTRARKTTGRKRGRH
jgi:hemerythrin superfamily protein